MDLGSKYTDTQIQKLERRIRSVYREAQRDIDSKIKDFNSRFETKNKIQLEKVKKGEITDDEYKRWLSGQVFQGERWKAKRQEIAGVLYEANTKAVQITNGQKANVFAFNSNYQAYRLEHSAGVNFGFDLYDSATVVNLIKNEPNLLPKMSERVKKSIDVPWNTKKITRQIAQGIIQGEKLDDVAKRLSRVTDQNWKFMRTHARTAMTGAQNAGRQQRLNEAQKMGIQVHKEWMSTLDGRTRYTHRGLDGQKKPMSEPFEIEGYSIMFPGDPEAHPSMVYNCRCTLVGDLDGYPSEYKRYDNISGVPIENMTYEEWYEAKEGITRVNSFQSALGAAKTVQEVNDLMNSQDWWAGNWNPITGQESGQQKADLTGCDLDSAKSVAASYQQVFEKYPKLKGRFDAPDAHPHGMGSHTYAWCYTKKGGKVQVNPKKYSNWGKLVKSFEEDVVPGWHPLGTTAESIVVHEIGHAIDGLLAREGILGGLTSSGEYRYASSSLKNTIMKRAAKKDEKLSEAMRMWPWDSKRSSTYAVEKYVSEYATKNNREWFAECFSEYITSANPRVVATEFGKELEKLLEKLP